MDVAFPINKYTGAADSAVVYFEIAPGDWLATHTDSQEEILYIVAGECEAHAGDEVCRLAAGDLAVIPAMVPHGVAKVLGDETLKVVGFFAGSTIISTFDEPLRADGAARYGAGRSRAGHGLVSSDGLGVAQRRRVLVGPGDDLVGRGLPSLGRKPDFMPKYTACGWWVTIASVDCSGSTAKPPVRRSPIEGASSRR